MFKRLFSAALLFGMAATAPPALAQNCAMRDQVVERLENKYSETMTAAGLQSQAKAMVEIWSSYETGTFTVIITRPNGVSCIVATGTNWHQKEFKPPEVGTAG